MTTLFDAVIWRSTTGGSGNLTVSGPVARFRTPLQAGVPDASEVSYRIDDDNGNWEIGGGHTLTSATQFARSAVEASFDGSTYSTALLTLSSAVQVSFVARESDIFNKTGNTAILQVVNAGVVGGEFHTAISAGTVNLDLRLGNAADITALTASASGFTIGITGYPTNGTEWQFDLWLKNGGLATITWPTGIYWRTPSGGLSTTFSVANTAALLTGNYNIIIFAGPGDSSATIMGRIV